MHSPVNWALLGLVIERPSYPYELAQRFERTYRGVLALSSASHVYPALGRLKGRSLIEVVPGTHTGPRSRRHYRATESGLEEYREWLVDQVGEDRRRQELYVVQLAALTRDPQAALEIVERYEQACLAEGTRMGIEGTRSAAIDGRSEMLARLVDEERRLAIGAKLAWIEYARRELKALIAARVSRG